MSKADIAIKTGLELKKQGVRYVLGAKAKPPSVPKFLDCSGFVRYCLLSAGVKIPDGTYAQFNSSMPIELKDLKVGDLGFLQKPTDKGTNHVGIYVGKGNWMHCNYSRNGITVEPTKMFNKYPRRYLPLFAGEKGEKPMIEVTDKERGYGEDAIKYLAEQKVITNPDKHIANLRIDASNWALWVAQANILRGMKANG